MFLNHPHSGVRYEHGLGEWYIVDTHNAIIAHHVTLEGLVRELGVLRPYEELDV